MIRETGAFVPLDERGREFRKFDYDLVMVSGEGPNGAGKTSALNQAMNILQSIHALVYAADQPAPPIKKVVEPPGLFVDQGRKDTWRSLIKEWKSKDGLIDENGLKDPYFQAMVFLWARRLVENDAVNIFPYMGAPFYTEPDSLLLKTEQRFPDSIENLEKTGLATLMKDRGTGSTLRYQGMDPDKGDQVRRLIYNLYGKGFLRREDMTILIMPYQEDDLRADGQGSKEVDRYTEGGNVGSYRKIKEHEGIFTRRIVEITNDPTGRRNCISTTACLIAMLTYMAEEEKRGRLSIVKGEVLHLPQFPLQEAVGRLGDIGTPGMESVSQNVSRDLGGTAYSGDWYVSGDVRMRIVDLGVDVIIS